MNTSEETQTSQEQTQVGKKHKTSQELSKNKQKKQKTTEKPLTQSEERKRSKSFIREQEIAIGKYLGTRSGRRLFINSNDPTD